jgi:hypothetical protein
MATVVLSFRDGPYPLEESEARLLCDHLPAEAWLKSELSTDLERITDEQQTYTGPTLRDFDPDRAFVLAAIDGVRAAGIELPDSLKRLALLLTDDEPLVS